MLPGAWAGADVGGVGRCPARSELMATRCATRIGDETLLTRADGVRRVGMGGAGCRDRGLGGLVAGWDARVLTASGRRRLPCRSGRSGPGSCGPAG
jgi:hypothetical protein